MATKTMYATGSLKYGTRRLQAGDSVEMNGRDQRLYAALGKVTDQAPRNAVKVPREPEAAKAPVKAPAAKAAAPKRAPRKRKAKAKK